MKHMEVAFRELLRGVEEFPDPGENPRIVEYLRSVGVGPDDETPWCSAFVNWCFECGGVLGTKSPAARSWKSWGIVVETPKLGDVAVLWRGSITSWMGHVGFYVGEGGGSVLILGGNQGNRISIMPYSAVRVLCYRRKP